MKVIVYARIRLEFTNVDIPVAYLEFSLGGGLVYLASYKRKNKKRPINITIFKKIKRILLAFVRVTTTFL